MLTKRSAETQTAYALLSESKTEKKTEAKQTKTAQDVLNLIQKFITENKVKLKVKVEGLRGFFGVLDPMIGKIEKEIQKTKVTPEKKLAAIEAYLRPHAWRDFFSGKLAHRFYSMVYHGLRRSPGNFEKQYGEIQANFARIFERPAFGSHRP